MAAELPPLTEDERATYEWQMWVSDFGEAGQRALKAASVLVSRVGGVGGTAAYYLAAAGIGRLVLAHAGDLRASDLNRQLLMTHEGLGHSRVGSARRRLLELNPRLQVEAVAENVSEANVARLVSSVDLIVDAAPRFGERFLLNREAVRLRRPMVDAAMFELELRLTSIVPGQTPCLACLYPADPPEWKREFPVFGAVAGSVGSLAAMEAIKLIAGVGEPLRGRMLIGNLRDMTFRTVKVQRNPTCAICSGVSQNR